MSYYGIDYGLGTSNIDTATGIRFGVIPMNDLRGEAWDDLEADYGPPTCGHCGNEAVEYDEEKHGGYEGDDCCDYACESCERVISSDDAFGDEPQCWSIDDGEYKGFADSDGDLFVLASPYYTHAQFCSPCAPGACHLRNPVDRGGPRCFCLGHDWFESGKAPYPIWRVADGTFVKPTGK